MMSRRQDKHLLIQVIPNLLQISLPMDPEPGDLCQIELWLRRARSDNLPFICDRPAPCCGAPRINTARCACGQPDSRWLLRYPASDYGDGNIVFRLDANLHRLPPGEYLAEVRDCGKAIYQFEVEVPSARSVGAAGAEIALFTGDGTCPDAGVARDDADNTFSSWFGYQSTLHGAMSRATTVIAVVDMPAAPADGDQLPELVVSDGVSEERVTVTWVNRQFLGIARGLTPVAFAPGACIRFAWTPNNLEASGYKNPNFIECSDIWCCGTMDCDEDCA